MLFGYSKLYISTVCCFHHKLGKPSWILYEPSPQPQLFQLSHATSRTAQPKTRLVRPQWATRLRILVKQGPATLKIDPDRVDNEKLDATRSKGHRH